ncbi:acyltransferase [Helicobacter sp. MIT 21-1697]|uniref:acyltransferase n=1 Tax=Helicobacter sp. MIT 21-1697 TaxID=2993733 RepID=UPI00224B03D4|nr:acyltransferase [Helicobacter sp. MIT 21-1697]MCX2716787.1 acyltransferase [Helicobacter sp. MIT 21-1697]
MTYFIHPTSIIDENVSIGEGSKIWHFCHILSGSVIGTNCSFGQNCMVGPNVIIGNNLKAQNNISIYEGVRICDDVFLGPSVVFTNVINPRAFISQKSEFRPTLIKNGASIGANATIICGVEIGEYAFVGAGSVVTQNIPNFALYVGNPARHIAWVDKAGQRLIFNEKMIAYDSYDDTMYRLHNNHIEIISENL